MIKRLFDIAVAATVLLILCVPLLVVAVLLRLTGEGEVFYLQERVGYLGKIFRVTKFATMLKNSPNMGTQDITLRNDPRVLPFGKLLRKTKLNEVPQFWDVLVGKISLIGWRPLMPKGFADYPDWVQKKITQVRPGLTGIGSLAFRDEESIIAKAQADNMDLRKVYREEIMPYKGALECWYVDHRSFFIDCKILLGTAIAVLFPNWRGYRAWFKNLPEPESKMIREFMRLPSSSETQSAPPAALK